MTKVTAHNFDAIQGRPPSHAVLIRYRRCESCGAKFRSEEIIVWDSKRGIVEPDYMEGAFD